MLLLKALFSSRLEPNTYTRVYHDVEQSATQRPGLGFATELGVDTAILWYDRMESGKDSLIRPWCLRHRFRCVRAICI